MMPTAAWLSRASRARRALRLSASCSQSALEARQVVADQLLGLAGEAVQTGDLRAA